ncbi:hypothetical protein [Enterobacter ludwigii]|nr:hypothetical protein [Enterobacter ludwigii]
MSRWPRSTSNNPETAASAFMDLKMDLKVPDVGGFQWTSLE